MVICHPFSLLKILRRNGTQLELLPAQLRWMEEQRALPLAMLRLKAFRLHVKRPGKEIRDWRKIPQVKSWIVKVRVLVTY